MNFWRTNTNYPTPKTMVRGIVPGKILEFCIAVGEFWYIFGERKQTFLTWNGVRGIIVPGEFVNSNSALLYREVLVNFRGTKILCFIIHNTNLSCNYHLRGCKKLNL